MALGVSFHNYQPLETKVRTLSNTVTLEIRSGTDDVTFFIGRQDSAMEDALALLNAVTELVNQVAALNAAKVEDVDYPRRKAPSAISLI